MWPWNPTSGNQTWFVPEPSSAACAAAASSARWRRRSVPRWCSVASHREPSSPCLIYLTCIQLTVGVCFLLACSAVQLDQGQYEALEALHPAWAVVVQHVPTSSYLDHDLLTLMCVSRGMRSIMVLCAGRLGVLMSSYSHARGYFEVWRTLTSFASGSRSTATCSTSWTCQICWRSRTQLSGPLLGLSWQGPCGRQAASCSFGHLRVAAAMCCYSRLPHCRACAPGSQSWTSQ